MTYIKALKKHYNDIYFLSIQSVKKQYADTVFGPVWALAQPFIYMLTFYFFFKIGWKFDSDIAGVPLILFVFAGNMPWLILSQSLTQGSRIFKKNAVVVKSIRFPVMALPLIETLAKMYVHICVMLITFIFFAINDFYPDIYYLNFIYYWIIMVLFLTGLTFLFGTISVIIKDIPQLIQSIMMPLFWFTPVLWVPEGKIEFVMKLVNPFYYFIDGYRQTLLYDKPFYDDYGYDLYMLVIIFFLYVISIAVYKKIRPIMADYL